VEAHTTDSTRIKLLSGLLLWCIRQVAPGIRCGNTVAGSTLAHGRDTSQTMGSKLVTSHEVTTDLAGPQQRSLHEVFRVSLCYVLDRVKSIMCCSWSITDLAGPQKQRHWLVQGSALSWPQVRQYPGRGPWHRRTLRLPSDLWGRADQITSDQQIRRDQHGDDGATSSTRPLHHTPHLPVDL
jgi:hypothetical protein